MTTPQIHHRFEVSVEVPGTPEQVWDAIATANGISSWMMPTDIEEREGGAVVFHMGPDVSSEGTVTGWDPPRRVVYEEPGWAALGGKEDADVTPLVTEFLVEATSGGSCVVRVVSSAFGTGADWEAEFFAEMGKGWPLMFEHLRLYLAHFPGRRVTPLEVAMPVTGTPAAALAAMRRDLGAEEVGRTLDVRGTKGVLAGSTDQSLLVRLTGDPLGLMAFHAYEWDGATHVRVAGYLFSDDAADYVEREEPGWRAWVEGLETEPTSP
jgi:uncharacterized protein YndB with AHSA1/START domain